MTALARVTALGRAESVLLRRNPAALLIALASPVGLLVFFRAAGMDSVSGHGAALVIVMTAVTLIFVVYYNLVTALVARRQELVLKRLRTGELADVEIIAGTAGPSVLIAWGQILVTIVVAALGTGLARPVNPALVLIAIMLGTAVFVLLAAATTVLTANVELAQFTTTPLTVVPLLLSGVMLPLDQLPEAVRQVARGLPLTPVVELLQLGLTGSTWDGGTVDLAGSLAPAVLPLLVLTGWLVLGGWVTRRWFRWEPRR
jgi:ABC-2 type transport system permease protein